MMTITETEDTHRMSKR